MENEFAANEGTQQAELKNVKYGGGPHGLGDPNDRTLRKVEKDVLVMKKVRDRTRDEKCTQQVAEFSKCCKDNGLLMVIKCRKENTALKSCLTNWYHNDDFVEECKQQYLDERSEYRRTGVTQRERDQIKKSTRMMSSM